MFNALPCYRRSAKFYDSPIARVFVLATGIWADYVAVDSAVQGAALSARSPRRFLFPHAGVFGQALCSGMLPFLSAVRGASIAAFGVCKTWQAQTISLVGGGIRLHIGVVFGTHLLATEQRTYLHKKLSAPSNACNGWRVTAALCTMRAGLNQAGSCLAPLNQRIKKCIDFRCQGWSLAWQVSGDFVLYSPFAMTHVTSSERSGREKGAASSGFFVSAYSLYRLAGRLAFSPSVEWGALHGRGRSSPVLMLLYIEAVPDASPRVQGAVLPCAAALRFRPINPPFFSRVTS
ncbi:hypothetical protein GIV65_19045 [Pseudomonas syringae]|nr:hypothetical protein [Pseudomonas syringae]